MLEPANFPRERALNDPGPGLPEHLIGLPGGSWAVWRWVGLRSAGFPAGDALRLASPRCAAAADELLRVESVLQATRNDALSQVRRAFMVARVQANPTEMRTLSRVRRQLESKRLPVSFEIPAIAAAIETLRWTTAEATAARLHFDELFCAARDEASKAIRQIAAEPRFREAVAWQNHTVLQSCFESLLRDKVRSRSSKCRQREELIANYLHRYCLKNETIGFFGPVGWGRFVDVGQALYIKPGLKLLRSRRVYFEQWAIDLLANQLSRIEGLKEWIAVRPTPVAHIDGLTVHVPFRPSIALTKEEMAVFVACDGIRTTRQLAEMLCDKGSRPRLTRDHVDAILDKLHAKRLLSLNLDLPLDPHPELRLRELLERVEDERLRHHAMAPLAKLESDRNSVAAAAGDPDRLRNALVDLDSHFAALTGESPSRSAGQMYAGRTLVYEDCERDIALRIGQPILASLGPPLTLVLSSARWLTYRVGQHCRAIFLALFDRLARVSGSGSVGFVEFYNYALNLLSKDTAFDGFSQELQQRWTEILSPPGAAASVRYTSGKLKAGVAEAFYAPSPGWPGACYHSPDLMIAGSSPEAINSGDCYFVLGELHVGANTLRGQFFVEQHPDANDIFRGVDADLPGVRLAPITPKRYAQRAARIFPVLTSRGQYFAATTLDSIAPFGSASLAGASLEVRKAGPDLVIIGRNGDLRFDLLQSFAGILARIVIDNFAIIPPSAHTPRVSIDDLIVAREAWHFARTEVEFAEAARSCDRFVAARRWRASNGLPRWVFVKIPGEVKPLYLDFESPVAVDVVARRIRKHQPQLGDRDITFSEMLPSHGQHWLPDAEGRRYSCELRVITVDRKIADRSAETP